MQTIWRHQWTDCNCFWINVVLNHCESVSIRKNLKSCILDFAAIFSPLNLTVTLWSRSNHGTRLPHGSSLLVSLTSFLPFLNFFYPAFLSVADLSATDYGIAVECSVCVCVACQPLKSCEVSLGFF